MTTDRRNKLIQLMLAMNQATQVEDVFRLIVEGAAELVPATKAWFGMLDRETGRIEIVSASTELTIKHLMDVKLGEGIFGVALAEGRFKRVSDVRSKAWNKIYKEYWNDTMSQVAIPASIYNVPIRVGAKVTKDGNKKIGILNLENSKTNAFTDDNIELLKLLASNGAFLIDRLEYESKIQGVRTIERSIGELQVRPASHKEIIDTILKGINKVLGFTFINISLIDPTRTLIRSEHVFNSDRDSLLTEGFKKKNNHSLDSQDIQADIIRNRLLEVPEKDDSRLDRALLHEYNYDKFIRVFIPMIDPITNQAIGTFEAGYPRAYTEYIYEQDIQILKSFVDYAVYAIVSSRRDTIEQVIHELRAPIIGIRSHASLLQTYWYNSMSRPDAANKLQDILIDAEILLHNISDLEYLLIGRVAKKIKFEKVLIYRDVILKIIYQMKPVMQEFGLSINNIEFEIPENLRKLRIFTDKYRLSQVTYNLITNAIKYHDIKSEFRIIVQMLIVGEYLKISFKDWGMGIERQYQDFIFNQGFRTPEAEMKNVTGSGVGLAISKSIMKELNGDIFLEHHAKPTEFIVLLPIPNSI